MTKKNIENSNQQTLNDTENRESTDAEIRITYNSRRFIIESTHISHMKQL